MKNLKIVDIEIDGVDTKDYPDFCDAFIASASYENGVELNKKELAELNDNGAFVHEQVMTHLY